MLKPLGFVAHTPTMYSLPVYRSSACNVDRQAIADIVRIQVRLPYVLLLLKYAPKTIRTRKPQQTRSSTAVRLAEGTDNLLPLMISTLPLSYTWSSNNDPASAAQEHSRLHLPSERVKRLKRSHSSN
jgi:hypothetical protein